MELTDKVQSGLGDYGRWIAKFADAYFNVTGLMLFPGTLNVELPRAYNFPEHCLRLDRSDYPGDVNVSIVPCRIFGRRAVILRTEANQDGTGPHPRTLIEVATDIQLRVAHGLEDGDEVTVEVDS